MEGNLSGERFPSFGFLHLCCGIRLIGKAEWEELCQRGSSGNVMERRGGHKEVFAWLPLLFPMRGGLGLWFPYSLGTVSICFARKKAPFPMPHLAPCFKRFRWRPCGQRKRGSGQGCFPCQRMALALRSTGEAPLPVFREKPLGEAPLQACFGSGVRLPPSLLERPMNTA